MISKAWIHTDSDDDDLSILINGNEDQVIKVMQNMLLEKYTRMGMKTTPVTANDLAVAGVDKSLNSSPESRLIWQWQPILWYHAWHQLNCVSYELSQLEKKDIGMMGMESILVVVEVSLIWTFLSKLIFLF